MAIGHAESDIAAEQRRIEVAEGEDGYCTICGVELDQYLPADEFTDEGVCSKRCADAVIAECGGKPNEFTLAEALMNPFAIELARVNLNSQSPVVNKPSLDAMKAEGAMLITGRRNLIGEEIEAAKGKLFLLLLQLWNEEYTMEERQLIEALLADRKASGLDKELADTIP